MAKFYEFTQDQQKAWDGWLQSRPPVVQAIARDHPPNVLFELTTTKQKVYLYSYSEDGTVTIIVDSRFNPFCLPNRRVFGVNPANLVECDVPEEWHP